MSDTFYARDALEGAATDLPGLPVTVEFDSSRVIGHVVASEVDDGGLVVHLAITSPEAARIVGSLDGFSVSAEDAS